MLRHVLLILVALLAPTLAAGADEHLTTAKLGKSAVACQKVIAQVGAKVLADKLKAIDACANATLACVQTKQDKPDCRAKAAATCAKQLDKAAQGLAKSQAKIIGAKSCALELRLPDLLSADGLGLGDAAGDCQTDFGLDVCGGLDSLAACLVRTRDRAAGAIFGEVRPRTSELLDPTLPGVAGLPVFHGCGTCGAPPASRKAVEQCGKALSKARQALGASLEKTLAGCAEKVLGCVQTKSDDPKCRPGATAGCDKAAAKLDATLGKFAAAVAKKCGPAAVDFSELTAPSGLGLGALAPHCTTAPTDAAGAAACLQSLAQCTTATLVRQTVGRTGAFAESGDLGGLGPGAAATCPALESAVQTHAATTPRFIFGGITKFLKSVRRPFGSVNGSLVSGGRPASSLGASRGIIAVRAPSRFTFGGISKIQFHYKTAGALSRSARAADPPALIVAIQRSDAALDDHFEVPLDPNPGAAEADDEIEVTFQDTIPGCAFALALATRIDGVVSDYTPVPVVLDTTLPPPTNFVVTQIMDESGDGNGHGLNDALGLAIDLNGALYVTGAASNNVLRRGTDGFISEIGDATGDGLGHVLNFPSAAAITGSDNVFVVSAAPAPDSYVFHFSAGNVSHNTMLDPSGDGTHAFNGGGGITADLDETFYVTGALSDNAFKVTLGGAITQLIDASGDGAHPLNEPGGIAVDLSTGDVYVTGRLSNNVFKITPAGVITQIIDENGDGVHGLGEPVDVAVDTAHNAYVVGSATSNVFKIAPGGAITQIMDASGDGSGGFAEPVAVATLGTDAYVLGGTSSRRGYKISGSTIVELIGPGGDGVHPFELPGDIAVDGLGNVYVSDRANRVFQIAP
jgi:DNA-binding beta-propeller fold protein YncE